jgi:hypothetical protein
LRQVDAKLALIRHAVAFGVEPPRVSPLKRRRSMAEKMFAEAEAKCPITDEVREEYAYVFGERVSVYVYEGVPERCGSKTYHGGECCAFHVALYEVGCVEYWAHPKGEDFPPVRVPTPRPVGHCARCESVGHEAGRCPFPVGDAAVMKAARIRRERRARRETAA